MSHMSEFQARLRSAEKPEDLEGLVPSGGGAGGPVEWEDIESKPSSFPPGDHEHPGYAAGADLEALAERVKALEDAAKKK
ncbi:hypothetical protein HNR23_002241 [Nocardiopsis mwathae]|uniref:Uncharacterized protein n=1 Tax=Nocardiopsis mwathae TaxID=1472723 RepID=A0A7W9YJ79_9ACTN|nr:hypothetical protein [Nocardiopsis mwathae]MBB6172181.1 hypothetical protein [Nocardiopsis mwathae]